MDNESNRNPILCEKIGSGSKVVDQMTLEKEKRIETCCIGVDANIVMLL